MLHYRVTVADAIAAHERAIHSSGGRGGIQDLGRIDAAVARPYSGYHRYIYQKAAVLLEAVANNHGFTDGNKRTAFLLFHLLLAESGYRCLKKSTIQDEDEIERLVLDLTTHYLSLSEATAWLKARIVKAHARPRMQSAALFVRR